MAKFILSAFADEAGSTLDEQICALRENGIHYIEPRSINGKGILELSEEELLSVKKALDESGIRVNSLGSPIGKYDIASDFEPHLSLFRKALSACLSLGTERMRIFSFFVSRDELAIRRGEVLERLGIMLREAEKYGIKLCHENESGIYGQDPEEVLELLTELPALYGIFDPANYIMNAASPTEGINATLKNFEYMHIKDAICETQEIVPAGEGEGSIGEIIDLIDGKTDNKVFLTLEPHLRVFDAYKSIDTHELRGKYEFKTNREAFDFAADALKRLLTSHGYEEKNGIWTR